MINTISAPVSTFATRPASTPGRVDCPAPVPQPPADAVDLTTIDTPQKVAQLPIFEPTFQIGIAAAAAVAIFSAMGGGQAPAINLALTSLVGDESVLGVSYGFDVNNQDNPVSAEGAVFSMSGTESKMAEISGGLTFDEANEQVVWSGKIGDAVESFNFTPTEDGDNPGLRMSGSVGSIPVDVNFSILGDLDHGQEGVEGYKVSGSIGDQAYQTVSRYELRQDFDNLPDPKVGDSLELATMTTRGHLGESEIAKDYTVTGSLDSKTSVSVTASGAGVNAGLYQVVESTLAVSDLPSGMLDQG